MKVDDSTPVILIVAVLSGIVKISITEFTTITELMSRPLATCLSILVSDMVQRLQNPRLSKKLSVLNEDRFHSLLEKGIYVNTCNKLIFDKNQETNSDDLR